MELLNCRFVSRVAGGQWESKLVPYIRKYSMRNKTSIVTSAADGCGQPSSIRSMDNLPSRDHKGAEYKESFMFSNRSSVSHGSALAIAAFATVALVGLAGTVSASVVTTIYSESFGGAPTTTPLAGTAPTVDNGTSSTWTATSGISDSGYTNNSTAIGYLSFTPISGNIYTLSANLAGSGTPNNGAWLSLGFLITPTTSGNVRFDGSGSGTENAVDWVLLYTPGSSTVNGSLFEGPGTSAGGANYYVGNDQNSSGLDTGDFSIVLNTAGTPSAWTAKIFDNGTAISGNLSVPSGITAVGIGNDGTVSAGQFSNFSLTSSPVPEPATLGLVAIGGLGLLLLKRRKAV